MSAPLAPIDVASAGPHDCSVPTVVGLSLAGARARLIRAGCALVVRDARSSAQEPTLQSHQIVVRQAPPGGHTARQVTVWLKPLCSQSALPGLGIVNGASRPGPTELISGLFLVGGPHRFRPECLRATSFPGRITVTDPASGRTVAAHTVTAGHLAVIPLAPGTYAIQGTFAGAFSNGEPIQTRREQVTITAAKSLRQDLSVGIP